LAPQTHSDRTLWRPTRVRKGGRSGRGTDLKSDREGTQDDHKRTQDYDDPELLAAAADARVRTIRVAASLNGLPSFHLSPGQSLTIAGPLATLRFAEGQAQSIATAAYLLARPIASPAVCLSSRVPTWTVCATAALSRPKVPTIWCSTTGAQSTTGSLTTKSPPTGRGVGFVNFGIVNRLQANAAIETFGQGARGFNVYTGTVNTAEFERVVTHADGAVGIQISHPVGGLLFAAGSRPTAEPATPWSRASFSGFRPLRSASSPAAQPERLASQAGLSPMVKVSPRSSCMGSRLSLGYGRFYGGGRRVRQNLDSVPTASPDAAERGQGKGRP
jgi:hypothetical protein